ncbi:Mu-like prophage major head subunit gpT family protein [Segeticoccus rhizosphaerae]|uniref:phage major capsid protein n=1 Tax=Segeticoccus rhizosphaerae TaxID=1104777 RepID=UPI001264FD47|nr:Mu-like prophage major head subunit gpT family protein [Segeticoccus rhizosphaerae]
MTSSILTGEAFGLSPELTMVGEGPRARRERERASERMRRAMVEAKAMLEAAWGGDPLARIRVNEAITTSDLFKSAAGAVLDREMLAAYQTVTPSWQAYAAPTFVKDFKPKTLTELIGNTGALPKVPEHTNYPIAQSDAAERQIRVAKFGQQYGYTLEARINDDIGELQSVPNGWAAQATATEAHNALSQLANPLTGAPNTAFFTGGNLGTGALTADNLQTAYTAVTTKRDKDGALLVAPAMQLVVGPALQFTAERILNTSEIRTTVGSDTFIQSNPFSGKVKLTVLSDLPGTAWFLLPVPQAGRKSAFYVAHLRGFETPDLRAKADQGVRIGGGAIPAGEGSFDDDTIWFRVRHITGAAPGDPTFTYASDGIAA